MKVRPIDLLLAVLLIVWNLSLLFSLLDLVFELEVARELGAHQLGEDRQVDGCPDPQTNRLHSRVFYAVVHHDVRQGVVDGADDVLSRLFAAHRGPRHSERVVRPVPHMEVRVVKQVVDRGFELTALQVTQLCWVRELLVRVEELPQRLSKHLVDPDIREEEMELVQQDLIYHCT